jgi:hypothetical protein
VIIDGRWAPLALHAKVFLGDVARTVWQRRVHNTRLDIAGKHVGPSRRLLMDRYDDKLGVLVLEHPLDNVKVFTNSDEALEVGDKNHGSVACELCSVGVVNAVGKLNVTSLDAALDLRWIAGEVAYRCFQLPDLIFRLDIVTQKGPSEGAIVVWHTTAACESLQDVNVNEAGLILEVGGMDMNNAQTPLLAELALYSPKDNLCVVQGVACMDVIDLSPASALDSVSDDIDDFLPINLTIQ